MAPFHLPLSEFLYNSLFPQIVYDISDVPLDEEISETLKGPVLLIFVPLPSRNKCENVRLSFCREGL
ncbi:unnamed protein product [Eruca vesicaria subsp. sativa]|uniref:Uncharacterized protein n=1 Tax=Eruca vesicaria subsp. sativa TaxID=29727 RepID=A0ABC8KVN0_ERUVS|nr:unnamed protein product [Eruca vesicaria subsp. sativa]